LIAVTHFFELFGVRRPLRFELPIPAGDYNHAVHSDHPGAPSLLQNYLDNEPKPEPQLGGAPKETEKPDDSLDT
ncbi:MAG TPA: hypothetical protein VF813_12250, partial [Anaerolineaceae bacterium]